MKKQGRNERRKGKEGKACTDREEGRKDKGREGRKEGRGIKKGQGKKGQGKKGQGKTGQGEEKRIMIGKEVKVRLRG
jgi:DNA-repair protein complementing XP-A cells